METVRVVPKDELDPISYHKMFFSQLGEVDNAVNRYSETNNIETIWTLQLTEYGEWRLMYCKKFTKKSRHKLKNKIKHFIKIHHTVEWNTGDVKDGCKIIKLKGK